MAIGAKHVLLVAVATLLLTYAVYQGKSSNGDTVSMQGRKSLPDPRFLETTPVLAENSVMEMESDTTEAATFETIEGDALTPTNVESEETSVEATEEVSESVSEEVLEEPAVEETGETTTEDSTAEGATTEETSKEDATTADDFWSSEGNAEDVQTEENVDVSAEKQEGSGEASEEKQVREMLDAVSSVLLDTAVAPAPSTVIQNPDSSNYPKPKVNNPNIFLNEIARDNIQHRQNEGFIQSCIKEDGCGTPEP